MAHQSYFRYFALRLRNLHRHDAPLGLGALADVPLRIGERGVTGERLHVPLMRRSSARLSAPHI
jgi:hypothetical protein